MVTLPNRYSFRTSPKYISNIYFIRFIPCSKNFGHIIFSWPTLLINYWVDPNGRQPKVGGCINRNRRNISFAPNIFCAGDNYFNIIAGSFNCNRNINGSQETLEELFFLKCPVFNCCGQKGAI